MAECRHASQHNQENCQIGAGFLNFSTLLTNGDLSNLYYDGEIIKWNGDLTLLKRITSEAFRLEGKWSSPGGKRKKFVSSNTDLSFTWYPEKQNSLIFQGRGGDTLQNVCIRYCEVKQSRSGNKFSNEFCESDRLSADDNKSVCISHDIKNSIPISAVGVSAEMPEPLSKNDIQAKKYKNVRSDPSVCELLNKPDCSCQCGVLAAELEGVKLDMIIMNKNIESKIFATREKDEIARLRKDLDIEREKCERFESDIATLVSGRNQEIYELNKTNVSLENDLKAAKVNNESLKEIIMHIYSNKHLKSNQCKISPSSNLPNEHNQINEHDQTDFVRLNQPNEHDQIKYSCSFKVNELISDNTNYVCAELNTITNTNTNTITPELLPSTPCSNKKLKLNVNTINEDDNNLTKATEDHQHCRPTTQLPEWINMLPLIEISKSPIKLNGSNPTASKPNVLRESDNATWKSKIHQNPPDELGLTEIPESNPRPTTHSSQFFWGLPVPYRDKYGKLH